MAAKYDHLTREQLLDLITKRDAERRLGLVWERDEIEHEKELNGNYVALTLDEALSVGEPPWENLLIEGDNFDALRQLGMAYRGKIQCIYIDPPYNTGNQDFIYNDRFLDKDDAWRHSKWLEFMYRRLLLARDLLTPDGAILVSIDDDNRARLDLLMEQVFPGMRVGSLVWRKRRPSNAANIEHFFSSDHEHVLVYGGPEFTFQGSEKRWSGYDTWDNDVQDYWASGDLTLGFTREQRANLYYPLLNPVTQIWYPCDPDRVWVYASRDRLNGRKVRTKPMEDWIASHRVNFPTEEQPALYTSVGEIRDAIAAGTAPLFLDRDPDLEFWVGKKIGFQKPRLKRFRKDLRRSTQPLSSWIAESGHGNVDVMEEVDGEEFTSFEIESGMTSEGTKALREIGVTGFPYPKPPSLLYNLLRQVSDQNGIVLDFFAGSATTSQAVLELNAEDGGRRRFIMVSSTEATEADLEKNICRDVARSRLRAVIEGYTPAGRGAREDVPGLGGGFAYLRSSRTPLATLHLSLRPEQTWSLLQMRHAQVIQPYQSGSAVQVAHLDGMTIAYVDDLTPASLDEVERLVAKATEPVIVYSWQSGVVQQRLLQEYVMPKGVAEVLIEGWTR